MLRLLLAAFLLLPNLPLAAQVPPAQGAPAKDQRSVLFSAWINEHPDDLWAADAPAAAKQAVADYNAKKALGEKLVYGASLRGLKLAGLTAKSIDEQLKKRGFQRHDDFIRDPKSKEPLLGKDKKPVAMTVYTHADGAMIRVKPDGDPFSKFRPQPQAVKAVRGPPDADYRDFAAEAFKVEAGGDRAIPKSPREVKNPYKDTELSNTFLDGWGDAAHSDVAVPVEKAAPPSPKH
jgi:hypothetical protein